MNHLHPGHLHLPCPGHPQGARVPDIIIVALRIIIIVKLYRVDSLMVITVILSIVLMYIIVLCYLTALLASVTKDSLFLSFKLLLIYARLSTMGSTAITVLSMAAIMMVYMPIFDPASEENKCFVID